MSGVSAPARNTIPPPPTPPPPAPRPCPGPVPALIPQAGDARGACLQVPASSTGRVGRRRPPPLALRRRAGGPDNVADMGNRDPEGTWMVVFPPPPLSSLLPPPPELDVVRAPGAGPLQGQKMVKGGAPGLGER